MSARTHNPLSAGGHLDRWAEGDFVPESPPGGWWEDEHDFAPLRAYLAQHPAVEQLPWEYMGSVPGGAMYRERETGLRLLLGANGAPWR